MTPNAHRPDALGDDPDEWASQQDGFRSAAEAAGNIAASVESASSLVDWDAPAGHERRDRLHHDAAEADHCATILHEMATICGEIAQHAASATDDLDRLHIEAETVPDDERPRVLAEIDQRVARHTEVTAPLRHRLGVLAAELDPVISRGDPLYAYFTPVTLDDPQGDQVIADDLVADYLQTGTLSP